MKKLETKELEKVSGGDENNLQPIICSSCGIKFYGYIDAAEIRTVKDGCCEMREFKCPNCGQWN